jgi:hypothetical protein
MYEELAPLVRGVMDGHSACVFAYGQTSSGKTYTMSGPTDQKRTEQMHGLQYRALHDLFKQVSLPGMSWLGAGLDTGLARGRQRTGLERGEQATRIAVLHLHAWSSLVRGGVWAQPAPLTDVRAGGRRRSGPTHSTRCRFRCWRSTTISYATCWWMFAVRMISSWWTVW